MITLVVLGVTVVLFILDRLPVAVVAMIVPLTLWATGVIGLGRPPRASVTRPSCSSRRCSW
ncbi:hypothetical protein [Tessaracoccus coleopterorum]|uniref:hypothetical protein n=1 Tax=Tessaracoccus coleopterorum TaxID=2714950 RepID=UPI001E62840F|nr:hypothetical protein [Tessaracoccus coleopterorum]